MKVILLQDVKKVGQRGTIVDVADGYANNVLMPKKLALPATSENLKKHEVAQRAGKEKVAYTAELALKALKEIEGKKVTIQARANAGGTLFESIHEKQIAGAIQKELGISIPEETITTPEGHIKKLGEHRVHISLHGKKAEISIEVSTL